MPLLCISLCALLLLPLTLSCDSRFPLKRIALAYSQTVKTDLIKTTTDITELLQNSTCTKNHKLPNCTLNNRDVVDTLLRLACGMKKLNTNTTKMALSVQSSINCYCPQKVSKRRKRENRRLCKVKASLFNIDECYQLLNANGHPRPASSVS